MIRLYQDTQAYSRLLMHRADFDMIHDVIRDQMVERMSVEILTEKVAEDAYEIVERPHYPTWRHQLVASLPLGSFRRRFLAYFWDDVNYEDPSGRIVKHTVKVHRWIEHPEQGVRKQSIEHMGEWV